MATGECRVNPARFQTETLPALAKRTHHGSSRKADVIVATTGYKNQQDVVRHSLGDEIADRIGPVWSFDNYCEMRNMWCRTAHPGMWFVGGGLPQVRTYSKFLA
jgi:hypothetical protein